MYLEIKYGRRNQNKTLSQILPILGFILIICSILFFDNKIFHPSFYTLIPVIGVVLILWFTDKNDIISKILSYRIFVGIGLISYSLYLWHYPIFSFAKNLDFLFDDNFDNCIIYFIDIYILLD